jgi:DNA-binding CsgD family transcriptional regulator
MIDYGMARQATHAAWLRLGYPAWSPQDWEDLIQDAALEMVKAAPVAAMLYPDSEDRRRGYMHGAAKRAAIVGWLRGIVAHNPANPYPLDFSEWIEVEEPSDEPEAGLSDEIKRDLEMIFRNDRKQQRGRAVAAAKRDVLICDLLVRGYRNRGIAHALGLSIKSVEKYRKHIRAILQAAASQQQAA